MPTHTYLQHRSAPVTLVHGYANEVIYDGSSLKLKPHFKPGNTLITLSEQTHSGMEENKEYRQVLQRTL